MTEIGCGSVPQRLWAKPAITVIGIDTTSVAAASNTLIPRARAKISIRVAPGGDAVAHLDALEAHLKRHAPWGAQVNVIRGEVGQPYAIDASGPVYDAARAAFRQAWGADAVDMGMGGSIPFIAEFAAAFPQAKILVTGVEDPERRRTASTRACTWACWNARPSPRRCCWRIWADRELGP